jgi:energy-converting hydrogenase Eha subunit E
VVFSVFYLIPTFVDICTCVAVKGGGRGRDSMVVEFTTTYKIGVCLFVFNAIFNNISVISLRSVISWRSVLLVEETEENHQPAASH